MKLSMHHIIATATLCVLSVLPSLACTSFIVSGKATKSGRPMIFKNRDTGNLDNCMVTVKGFGQRRDMVGPQRGGLCHNEHRCL